MKPARGPGGLSYSVKTGLSETMSMRRKGDHTGGRAGDLQADPSDRAFTLLCKYVVALFCFMLSRELQMVWTM